MLNIMVIENEHEQCKNIVNYISKFCPKIRVSYIAFDASEAIDVIQEQTVDLIILNLDLPNLDSFNIFNYISKHKIKKYKDSIIAFSKQKIVNNLLDSPYLNKYFLKPVELKQIAFEINKICDLRLSKSSDTIIKSKISHELHILNYDFTYYGSTYLVEAIYQIYINKEKYYDNLSRDIYPIIAKIYNKKENTIKGDISQATRKMLSTCDKKIINKYFGMTEYPTLKNIIFTILNKI